MARDPAALTVYRDTSARFLAVFPDERTWKFVLDDDGSVRVDGPQPLQLWFKWCPSDWQRAENASALPPAIQTAIATLL